MTAQSSPSPASYDPSICSPSSHGRFNFSMILHVLSLLFLIPSLAFDSPGFKERNHHHHQVPWFAETASNLTVAEGRTATLPCVVEDLGNYRLAWLHKDRHNLLTLHDKVITHNPRVSIHHSNYRSWELEISDVRLEDTGTYMCQVNTAPMISQTSHLQVVVPPSIDEEYTSSDQNVREGADVNLKCRASGSPKPVIKWRREEDKEIILGAKRVPTLEGEFLKLKRTSRLSMGAYLCIATNGVLPSVSKRIMLNVHFAPMILIPSQLIGASIGEDVTLVCNLESHPRSVTYWVIAGSIMVINNNKYRVSEAPSDHPAIYKLKLMLTIRDLRPQDFGAYTCHAKNSLGETEGTIALYEKPRPSTTESEDNYYYGAKGNEIAREDSHPLADNIKLGMASDVSFKPVAERKERMEEVERQLITSNTHHTVKNERKFLANPIFSIPKWILTKETYSGSYANILRQTFIKVIISSAYLCFCYVFFFGE